MQSVATDCRILVHGASSITVKYFENISSFLITDFPISRTLNSPLEQIEELGAKTKFTLWTSIKTNPKIFAGVTILLSQTVFSLLVGNVITKTSEAVPLLGTGTNTFSINFYVMIYLKKKKEKKTAN